MADPVIITEAVRILVHDPALPKTVMVFEAGCGSTSDVNLPFKKKIVGIDDGPTRNPRPVLGQLRRSHSESTICRLYLKFWSVGVTRGRKECSSRQKVR